MISIGPCSSKQSPFHPSHKSTPPPRPLSAPLGLVPCSPFDVRGGSTPHSLHGAQRLAGEVGDSGICGNLRAPGDRGAAADRTWRSRMSGRRCQMMGGGVPVSCSVMVAGIYSPLFLRKCLAVQLLISAKLICYHYHLQ